MEKDKNCRLAGSLDLVIFMKTDKVEVWDSQYLTVVAVDLDIIIY